MPQSVPEPLRLGLIGAGAVTELHHLPAIAASPAVTAAAIVDPDERRAADLARRFAIPTVAAAAEAVAGSIDAAIVAAPNHLHAAITIAMLERGVPVLVEKPMALSAAECDAMIAAAARGGAVLAVGLEFRFFDSTAHVRRLLESGILGRLDSFELRLGVVPRWPFASDTFLRRETAGGGVLADYGVHLLDLLLVWLGELEVAAYRDDARGGVEADCEIELRAGPAAAPGFAELSRSRNLRNTCVFTGSRARLEVGLWEPDPLIAVRLQGARDEMDLAGRARRRDVAVGDDGGLDFHRAFVRQIEDFAAAVRAGGSPRVPGAEGRRSVALVEACYAVRRPLELPWE